MMHGQKDIKSSQHLLQLSLHVLFDLASRVVMSLDGKLQEMARLFFFV
jgi:hypothetical protein